MMLDMYPLHHTVSRPLHPCMLDGSLRRRAASLGNDGGGILEVLYEGDHSQLRHFRPAQLETFEDSLSSSSLW